MMFEYLENISGEFNKEELIKIKSERETWLLRDSAKKYKKLLDNLPSIPANSSCRFDQPEVSINGSIDESLKESIKQDLETLIPWRKGPFHIFGETLDAEWRSDFKWDRLKAYLPNISEKVVLDIGCNNG